MKFTITLFSFKDSYDNEQRRACPTIILEMILMNTQNIEKLVEKALAICREQKFSESSIHGKHKIFKAIIRKHRDAGFENYNESVVLEYIEEQKTRFHEGHMLKEVYQLKEKTALQLKELVNTGTIDYGHVNRKTGVTDYYSGIIGQMLVFPEWDEKYAHNIRRYVIPFFKWLASHEISDISAVDEAVIRKYMTERAKTLRLNSICHMNYGLKRLFYFLKTARLIDEDYSYVFSLPLPKEHKIHKPISHDEIALTLNAIDRSTPQGMRDYAMILIGVVTGLRKENLRRIDAIDQKLEQNVERRQTLTTIMTRGYLDPALFTQESNDLAAEADALTAEKDQLVKEISGNIHRTDALSDLIRYAGHAKPSTSFDGALVERFLDHAVLRTRNEIVFHLKCGLSLTERIGEK